MNFTSALKSKLSTPAGKRALKTAVFFAVLLALLIVADSVFPTYSMPIMVLKKATVYSLLTVSLNLLNGFTGLFSLGQAGFMLIGAYTYGVLTIPVASRLSVYYTTGGGAIHFALPWILGVILAGAMAALLAFLIGLPVLKLKSDYLAIATLGFAEIVRALVQWSGVEKITNGSLPLKSYPKFANLLPYVLIVSVCLIFIILLLRSTYGRAFKAIRDDEIAAESMGINLAKHKTLAFVISSFFAGVGGALLAMYQTTVGASQFTSALTYEILLIVVIGGIGSVTGSVLASFLYIACSEWWLRGLDSGTFLGISLPTVFRGGFRLVVFSAVIMIIVLFFRKGIMGEREFDIDRFTGFFVRTLHDFIVKKIPHFIKKTLPHFVCVSVPAFFTKTLPAAFSKALGALHLSKKEEK